MVAKYRSILALIILLVPIILGGIFQSPPALADSGTTERVSISSAGEQGNNNSDDPSVSSDGRYVAFHSYATNLFAGDTNGYQDIFVRDRTAGTTTRVSIADDEAEADSDSYMSSISGNGQYVAFDSFASNLVAGDINGDYDIFVRDRTAGTTTRVSIANDEAEADSSSHNPSISSDGRYVAFESYATNLVIGDTGDHRDVFVRDRTEGTTTMVSVDSAGVQGNDDSGDPSISSDGHYIAFASIATNLVDGDTNALSDIFVHDRITGITTRVSLSSAGTAGDGHSHSPSISSDGRYVAFDSYASNLVTGDTDGYLDIFVRDRTAGTTARVSVSSTGVQADGDSQNPSISGDGRYVAFDSWPGNLVADDTNGNEDVFVRDRTLSTTSRANLSSAGAQVTDSDSFRPYISGDGRYVAFESDTAMLVAGDTNLKRDVFITNKYSSASGHMTPVSGNWNGTGGTEIGAYLNGAWYLDYNGNGAWNGTGTGKDRQYSFGSASMTPVTGNWNGAGGTEIGAYLNGTWYLDYNGNGAWNGAVTDRQYSFGSASMKPVTGDWNNDGKTEIGAYLNGTWYLDYNGNGAWNGTGTGKDRQYSFGSASMTPVSGNWDGAGGTEIGAYLNGTWYLDYNGNGAWNGAVTDRQYSFGSSTMTPVTGNWNGAGGTEIGAYLNGTWYLDYNGTGAWNGAVTDRQYSFGN